MCVGAVCEDPLPWRPHVCNGGATAVTQVSGYVNADHLISFCVMAIVSIPFFNCGRGDRDVPLCVPAIISESVASARMSNFRHAPIATYGFHDATPDADDSAPKGPRRRDGSSRAACVWCLDSVRGR